MDNKLVESLRCTAERAYFHFYPPGAVPSACKVYKSISFIVSGVEVDAPAIVVQPSSILLCTACILVVIIIIIGGKPLAIKTITSCSEWVIRNDAGKPTNS